MQDYENYISEGVNEDDQLINDYTPSGDPELDGTVERWCELDSKLNDMVLGKVKLSYDEHKAVVDELKSLGYKIKALKRKKMLARIGSTAD